jgi:circadian clock protein KaiC
MAVKVRKSKMPIVSDLERVPSGIPGLDQMIGGGFVRQSTALLRGGTGSGKTLMCLQYLHEGIMKFNEPGVYLSFAESEDSIFKHGKTFNWDFRTLTAQNKFAVIRYQPHEIVKIIDEGGGVIRDTVESMGAKRLVIDSLTAYEMMFDTAYKANESILTLLEILRKWNTTSLVTSESPITPLMAGKGRLGFLTDCIIHLYYLRVGSHRQRALEVLKMRDTNHSDEVHLFDLDRDGISVVKRLVRLGR